MPRPLKAIFSGPDVIATGEMTDADALNWGGGADIPSSDDVLAKLYPIHMELLVRAGAAIVANNTRPPGWRIPVAFVADNFYVRVGTAPVGSVLTVRLNKNGVAWITISVAAATTSASALNQNLAVAAGDIITADITAIGSGTAGSDVVVDIVGE